MFRAGLYAASLRAIKQTVPLQIRALRQYAVRRDWTIALQVKEVGSGASERQLWEGYWRRRAVARSTWCWYGDWIGGADR